MNSYKNPCENKLPYINPVKTFKSLTYASLFTLNCFSSTLESERQENLLKPRNTESSIAEEQTPFLLLRIPFQASRICWLGFSNLLSNKVDLKSNIKSIINHIIERNGLKIEFWLVETVSKHPVVSLNSILDHESYILACTNVQC